MENVMPYAGKMLYVDLTTGKTKTESSLPYFEEWLGGSGLAIKKLYDDIPVGTDPYSPGNEMIISAGLLIGTMAPGACKMSVSTLSPMTGGWATGSCDSYMGVSMKQAGYDQIIIKGKSKKPCLLYITDESVEILDAAEVWGCTTKDTFNFVREKMQDSSLHMLLIGQAGENLVRGAAIMHDYDRAVGRGGMGAVMGSKNLKGVICKGKLPIRVENGDAFNDLCLKLRKRLIQSPPAEAFHKYGSLACGQLEAKQVNCGIPYKNGSECQFPQDEYEKLDLKELVEKYQVRRKNFISCPLGCSRELYITDGPYAGLRTNVCQFDAIEAFYSRLALQEPTALFAINDACNNYGLDIVLAGCSIGWAIECYEHGILTKEDTDGVELEWGNDKQVLQLIDMIAHRQGFGDLLSQGCARAAEIVGKDSDKYAVYCKKQDQVESIRGANIWALGLLTSTRGGGHTTSMACYEQTTFIDKDRLFQVPGVDHLDEPLSYEGKAEAVAYFEVLCRVCNCTGICLANTVWSGMNPDYLNLKDLAEILSAATGKEYTEEALTEICMRQLLLEKAFNLRHTEYGRNDDMPRGRELTDPISSGKLKGWKFDIKKLNKMLDDYYIIHDWDPTNSYPTRAAYERYNLAYVAEDMERIGKLGKSFVRS